MKPSLLEEADILAPLFSSWFKLWREQQEEDRESDQCSQKSADKEHKEAGGGGRNDCTRRLRDFDVVGGALLCFLSLRRPSRWLNGPLPSPVTQTLFVDSLNPSAECFPKRGSLTDVSCSLAGLPGLLEVVSWEYVQRKMRTVWGREVQQEEVTVMTLFNLFQFAGVKKNSRNVVNEVMVQWAVAERHRRMHVIHSCAIQLLEREDEKEADVSDFMHLPLCFLPQAQLLSRVPTPMEVLRMQANRQRVVTLFTSFDDLSSHHVAKLSYMSGMQNNAKDPFEFLVHDLIHMHHFTDPSICLEQVGFFQAILSINEGHPRKFFQELFPNDKSLWPELEYLVSDMNCYSPHLMKYLLAKLLIANDRQYSLCPQNSDPDQKDEATAVHSKITPAEEEMMKLYKFMLKWLHVMRAMSLIELNIEDVEGLPRLFDTEKENCSQIEDKEKNLAKFGSNLSSLERSCLSLLFRSHYYARMFEDCLEGDALPCSKTSSLTNAFNTLKSLSAMTQQEEGEAFRMFFKCKAIVDFNVSARGNTPTWTTTK